MTDRDDERWIVIPNWEKFQHPDVIRAAKKGHALPWIRLYTGLLDDANYMRLSFRLRGLLVDIWMLYATHRMQLPDSPSYIARACGFPTEHELRSWREAGESVVRDGRDSHPAPVEDTVRRRDLERLEKAGFITLGASKPLASASTGASIEERRKNPYVSKGSNGTRARATRPEGAAPHAHNSDPYECPICHKRFRLLEMDEPHLDPEALEAHLIDTHELKADDQQIDAHLATAKRATP